MYLSHHELCGRLDICIVSLRDSKVRKRFLAGSSLVSDYAGHLTMESLRVIDLHALLWGLVMEPFLKNKITDTSGWGCVCVYVHCMRVIR